MEIRDQGLCLGEDCPHGDKVCIQGLKRILRTPTGSVKMRISPISGPVAQTVRVLPRAVPPGRTVSEGCASVLRRLPSAATRRGGGLEAVRGSGHERQDPSEDVGIRGRMLPPLGSRNLPRSSRPVEVHARDIFSRLVFHSELPLDGVTRPKGAAVQCTIHS